jgi:hypothetical protein
VLAQEIETIEGGRTAEERTGKGLKTYVSTAIMQSTRRLAEREHVLTTCAKATNRFRGLRRLYGNVRRFTNDLRDELGRGKEPCTRWPGVGAWFVWWLNATRVCVWVLPT